MLEVIRKIRQRKSFGSDFDPYRDLKPEAKPQISGFGTDVMPPKRRFVPSKWERIKIGRLARAIEKGWLKPKLEKKEEVFDIWADEDQEEKPAPPK
mmetsp:Transcript_23107/g.22897  ORF Transcript_23107/g.22897 Transcript_23107/m.22897 type:complete len:96 (+) Transcript_23107:227-514(+)